MCDKIVLKRVSIIFSFRVLDKIEIVRISSYNTKSYQSKLCIVRGLTIEYNKIIIDFAYMKDMSNKIWVLDFDRGINDGMNV